MLQSQEYYYYYPEEVGLLPYCQAFEADSAPVAVSVVVVVVVVYTAAFGVVLVVTVMGTVSILLLLLLFPQLLVWVDDSGSLYNHHMNQHY